LSNGTLWSKKSGSIKNASKRAPKFVPAVNEMRTG